MSRLPDATHCHQCDRTSCPYLDAINEAKGPMTRALRKRLAETREECRRLLIEEVRRARASSVPANADGRCPHCGASGWIDDDATDPTDPTRPEGGTDRCR